MSRSQQQMQATDIPDKEILMSINLPHIEGTTEKNSTFYTEITLHKLLWKQTYRLAAED